MDNTTTTVPEWLASSTLGHDATSTPSMAPVSPPMSVPDGRTPGSLRRELMNTQRAILFEAVLDRLEDGDSLARILEEHPYGGIKSANFISWVDRDPVRKERYDKAMSVYAEALFHRQADIASGANSMNDEKRDRLILETNWRMMEVLNKRRFGKDAANAPSSMEFNFSITHVDSPYTKPVPQEVLDVTPKHVPSNPQMLSTIEVPTDGE